MWLPTAFFCAAFTAGSDASVKQLLSRADERVVAWGTLLLGLPWLFAAAAIAGWPELTPRFWWIIAAMMPLELVGYLCSLKAIRIAPLSLVMPFQAFTPLLTVVTSWVLLGERVTAAGLLGVAAVTAGAYGMHAEHRKRGPLEPLRAMFRVQGVRLMLVTACVYSVTSALSKAAVQICDPVVFPFIYYSVDVLLLTALAVPRAGGPSRLAAEVSGRWRWYLLAGTLTAASFLLHCIGIRQAPVPYFLGIKRLSLLLTVLMGGLLFHEQGFRSRLASTALMISGAILITLTA